MWYRSYCDSCGALELDLELYSCDSMRDTAGEFVPRYVWACSSCGDGIEGRGYVRAAARGELAPRVVRDPVRGYRVARHAGFEWSSRGWLASPRSGSGRS